MQKVGSNGAGAWEGFCRGKDFYSDPGQQSVVLLQTGENYALLPENVVMELNYVPKKKNYKSEELLQLRAKGVGAIATDKGKFQQVSSCFLHISGQKAQ